MRIVKLDAIDSTNAYIKRKLRDGSINSNTVIVANDQYEGRGQMGTTWNSEPGKNLTFSVLSALHNYNVSDQFCLNMLVCDVIHTSLEQLGIPNLRIKWPNDILSGNNKLCGVLIETVVAGELIKNIIIGIGLNVNQTEFHDLSRVSSLKLLAARSFDHDQVLQLILKNLKHGLETVEQADFEDLHDVYESKLFMKDTSATFKLQDGRIREGVIKGVTKEGKLRIGFETPKEFGFKEIRLLY